MDPRFAQRLIPARPDLADVRLKGKVEAARYVEPKIKHVIQPVLDLYSKPGAAGLASQLLLGERFRILEEDRGSNLAWGQSELDGYVGYVPMSGLGTSGGSTKVTARSTHAYPQANMKTLPNLALPFGAHLLAGPAVERFRESHLGFLPEQHLDQPLSDDFVSIAEMLIGAPYLWGGRSSFGLDCSGLIQTALHSVGITAPRDSDMQEAMLGETLGSTETLCRGDLVFWKGHIGVMVDKTTLLHANSGAMAVAYEDLNSAAKRIEAAGDGPITARKRLG